MFVMDSAGSLKFRLLDLFQVSSSIAGIVGNSAALADIQEQDHQQSEQRKPAQKSTTSERRKSRRPASSRQNKRSKTQHENDGEQEQAMPKEEIVLQPDSPV